MICEHFTNQTFKTTECTWVYSPNANLLWKRKKSWDGTFKEICIITHETRGYNRGHNKTKYLSTFQIVSHPITMILQGFLFQNTMHQDPLQFHMLLLEWVLAFLIQSLKPYYFKLIQPSWSRFCPHFSSHYLQSLKPPSSSFPTLLYIPACFLTAR